MPQSTDLRCDVRYITYDFQTHTGTLVMAPGNSCQLDECLPFFASIDVHVRRIETFAGAAPDATYYLANGEWNAAYPQGRAKLKVIETPKDDGEGFK